MEFFLLLSLLIGKELEAQLRTAREQAAALQEQVQEVWTEKETAEHERNGMTLPLLDPPPSS
jgi:hypothetical protein